MPTKIEWLEEPYILQVTYQGDLTIEEIGAAWMQLGEMYEASQMESVCLLSLILPNTHVPVGILKLAYHPALKYRQHLSASVMVGINHWLLHVLTETINRLHIGPQVRLFQHYEEAQTFLQTFVRQKLEEAHLAHHR